MRNLRLKIAVLGMFFSAQTIHSKVDDCPQTIMPDFCIQLGGISDDVQISFQVGLTSAPPESAKDDPSKDTEAFQIGATSDSLAEYTRRLFESYDIRWPEDTTRRAAVPNQIERSYKVFATKKTVLAVSRESYVIELERWSPSIPSAIRNRIRNGKSDTHAPAINAKGQSIGVLGGGDSYSRMFRVPIKLD